MARGVAVDPVTIEKYVKMRQQGWKRAPAARQLGISERWAFNFDKGHENNGRGYRLAGQERAAELRGAIPLDDLCDEAKRALTDFEFFRRFYLGHVSTPWQVETAERLVALLDTPDKEYVVQNGPPGGGKTTLLHDIACWVTARNRGIRGLIGSRKALNAERMLRRIRRSLERPLPYRAATEDIALGLAVDAGASLAQHYGRFKPDNGDVWRGSEFIVEQLDDVPIEEKEPTWSSYGVDSGVLGNRFEIILWDDLVDRTNTRHSDAQVALQELWDTELETRLEPGGLLVLMGQRLSAGDLYAYCRSKQVDVADDEEELDPGATESGLMYHRIVYRAHDDERCQDVHARGEAKPWPDGCLLDPHRLPWKELRRIRSLNRTTYEITYQQADVAVDDVLVNPLWVRGGRGTDGIEYPGCWDYERGLGDRPPIGGAPLSVITVDPSPTRLWSVQWWVTDTYGGLESAPRYLMDLYRQKMTAPDLLYALPAATGRYEYTGMLEEWRLRAEGMGLRLSHVVIEQNAAQRFFTQQPYFQRWCSEHRIAFVPHTTHANKAHPEYGVGSLGEVWKFGLVRLPGKPKDEGRTHALKLVDEVQKWPHGTTDDCVMAHWFHEIALPRIAVVDPDSIPRLRRPSWMTEPDMAGVA
jgi:hypothetical protein